MTYPSSVDDDNDSDDELTELRAKEVRRRPQRRASKARCRTTHPDRIAASQQRYREKNRAKRRTNPRDLDELAELRAKEAQRRAARDRYRARHPDRVAASHQRYREKNRAKIQEAARQYYQNHLEKARATQKQYRLSQRGRLMRAQYQLKRRKALALATREKRRREEKRRTAEKLQALGPLKLTVTLEDFMRDFNDSIASTPEDSVDKDQPCAMTITDMDSGVLHPVDHSVCDLWNDGSSFLDNLLEELSEVPSSSSSSDDSLCDLSFEEWIECQTDSSFDLDDFVS